MNNKDQPSDSPEIQEQLNSEAASRRAFIRTSIFGSMAAAQPILFSNLVRANGGGGGGTTSPWGTTVPGQTTTPWGTTQPPYTTTQQTTWYSTTVPASCGRTYVSRVEVTFSSRGQDEEDEALIAAEAAAAAAAAAAPGDQGLQDAATAAAAAAAAANGRAAHPQPGHNQRSGAVYYGKLKYWEITCVNNSQNEALGGEMDVESGGFRVEPTNLEAGSDSSLAPGDYGLPAAATGSFWGFMIPPGSQPDDRSDMKFHEKVRPHGGSSGCVVTSDNHHTDEANQNVDPDSDITELINAFAQNISTCQMKATRGASACVASETNITTKVFYDGVPCPTFEWEDNTETTPGNPPAW